MGSSESLLSTDSKYKLTEIQPEDSGTNRRAYPRHLERCLVNVLITNELNSELTAPSITLTHLLLPVAHHILPDLLPERKSLRRRKMGQEIYETFERGTRRYHLPVSTVFVVPTLNFDLFQLGTNQVTPRETP